MDKDDQPIEYVGWIPTVSGRLSFSEFGKCEYPTSCIRASCSDGTSRYIISYQKRYLSDTTIPVVSSVKLLKSLADKFLSKEGTFWMCSSAVYCSDDNKLHGSVYVFNRECWRGGAEQISRERMDELDKLQGQCNFAQPIIDKFCDGVRDRSLIRLEYSVLRTGEVHIKYSKSNQGHSFINIEDFDIEDDIFNQVYYYLKDCLHKHQHHAQNTDSILQIYKTGSNSDWRIETLYTLYRKIINRRRNATLKDLNESLGVLAYASSFENIYAAFFESHKEKIIYNKDEIRQSINATLGSIANQFNPNKIIIRDAWKATIALAGLFFSLVALISITEHKIKNKISPGVNYLAERLVQSPFEMAAYLFGIIFVFFHVYHLEGLYREAFNDFVRLCVAGGRKTVIAAVVVAGASYIASLYLLFSLI